MWPKNRVVAEHQRAGPAFQKRAAEDEGLRQPVGPLLHRELEAHAPLRAAAEQSLELRLIVGCRDDENVADAGKHQHRQRIVDHRLVVDGQELLADAQRDRVQARSGAAGQYDASS